MTNSSSGAANVFSSFVIWASFVIRSFGIRHSFSCVSWVKASEAEHGEVDDSNDTQTKQEHVGLQIADLDQA
jgi:hypothetical protein